MNKTDCVKKIDPKDLREHGILLPVTSIPSKYGIGCFSKEAYDFVDFVSKCGAQYWQILPLGPTGYGDSPYQSFSTFAGNPYYIDFEALIQMGLLKEKECSECDWGGSIRYVDYEKVYLSRFKVLRKAYERSLDPELNLLKEKASEKTSEKASEKVSSLNTSKKVPRPVIKPFDRNGADYQAFLKDNADWLDDYCLYMAIKNSYEGVSWSEWDDDIKMRKPAALDKYRKELASEVDFYRFQQYLFASQWAALKGYANALGVKIIGDLPIYVAFDSADAWAGPELFDFDEEHNPIEVAGCPPDAFAATGQLWGNPLYNWKYHKNTGYSWWISRIRHCFKLYDVVRIDHFRGFESFYAIPAGAKDAVIGEWRKGPGIELFKKIREALGDVPIIAEDLGFLTDEVHELLKQSGYPGMKVLQFAFDPREPGDYLPHNYPVNCVVYTGTHDNDTSHHWYVTLPNEERYFVNEYIGKYDPEWDHISWDLIRLAAGSVARLSVIPMQDFLECMQEGRFNTPSTVGDNWKWRMVEGEYNDGLAERIRRLNWVFNRVR